LIFCMCVGHYHGLHGIETSSKSQVKAKMQSVWPQSSMEDSFLV